MPKPQPGSGVGPAAAGADGTVRVPLHIPGPASDEHNALRAGAQRVRSSPVLPNTLGLLRALRPLKRRVPSIREQELDEDATIRRIAEQRLWVPVLRPSPDRWLDLTLVVDEGAISRIWDGLATELRLLFEQLGAFRDVRLRYLHGSGEGALGISARRTRSGIGMRSPAELVDPTSRRLILVISDCIGTIWHTGKAERMLGRWARNGPVAILQPLPEHLWERTRLPPVPGRMYSTVPGGANDRMSFIRPGHRWRAARSSLLPIPVLEVDQDWLRPWARLVAGTAKGGIDGVAALLGADIPLARKPAANLSPYEQVMQFRSGASPMAYQLAGYLSAAPLSLGTMRTIQAAILPSSRLSHLAEVMCSGLLVPLSPEGFPTTDEQIYDFVDGVRDVLLGTLRRDEASRVLDEISTFVEHRLDRTGPGFIVAVPSEIGDLRLSALGRPLAQVRAHVERRILGRTISGKESSRPRAADRRPGPGLVNYRASDREAPTDKNTADEVLRRHFVAIATSEYDDPRYPPLPGVVTEVQTLHRWLCSTNLGRRRFAPLHEHLASNPSEQQIRDALRHPARRWNENDAVVVFVTGHLFQEAGTDWLALKETDSTVFASALRISDLVAWLAATNARHLVAIFDLCREGYATDTLRFDRPFPGTWLALASAGKSRMTKVGALTGVIADILADLATPRGGVFGDQPYLDEVQFFTEVDTRLRAIGQTLAPLNQRLLTAGPNPCLPNPRHQPDATAPVLRRRRDLAIRSEDLDSHWGPRSRGVAQAGEAGWLFTGRADLMRTLIAAAAGPPGTVVVTGRSGCGKSAALARLVTLSDPTFVDAYAEHVATIPEDLRPAVNAVDVAVLATGKLPHEVFAQLCDALDVPMARSSGRVPSLTNLRSAWWAWLEGQTHPVTIVVDALDEATNPRALLDEVLTQVGPPGATPRRVRLIVGVRSTGTDDPAPATAAGAALADLAEQRLHATRLRVDQPPLWSVPDVIAYIHQVLIAPDTSPYRTADPAGVDAIATVIANEAGSSYLIARLAATSLTTQPEPVDINDPLWRASLRDGVVGVFRADLHTSLPDPTDRERAVHLLRAVAFAYGRGLPWYQIWPLVANAVANHPERLYGDTDVAWLLSSRLGGYLVTDTQDNTTVYRLFHDALRIALRENVPYPAVPANGAMGEGIAATEARIGNALEHLAIPRVLSSQSVPPPSYVRRYLDVHKRAGGRVQITRCLGIHGIAQQQRGRHQMIAQWRAALADGLERAAGHPVPLPRLDIAFYGHLFLPPVQTGAKSGASIENPLDEGALLGGFDDEEIADLTLAAEEAFSGQDARFADSDAEVSKGYTQMPLVLQRLLRTLDRRFGIPAGLLYLSEIRQVRHYLCSPDIKDAADGIVAATVTDECRILVAHSLGSVVAFEYIRQHPDQPFDLLLTLGSPLASQMIRNRMPDPTYGAEGMPPNVASWVNLRDPQDPVAYGGDLRPFWPGVFDVAVDNQANAHSAERYLSKKAAGQALLNALPELAS